MLSLLPLLTLALSALMVNAAPAPAQVECKPAFRGPLTLYRYRQVPQGLEVSSDVKTADNHRVVTSSDAGVPGWDLTFFNCTSTLTKYGLPVTDANTTHSFGQLRTAGGRCITAITTKNSRNGKDQRQLVAKKCPTADGEAQRDVTFQLIKSDRNGLKYKNSNYKVVLTTATKQEQQASTTWDFDNAAILYGQSPRGQFGSSLRLRHAQELA